MRRKVQFVIFCSARRQAAQSPAFHWPGRQPAMKTGDSRAPRWIDQLPITIRQHQGRICDVSGRTADRRRVVVLVRAHWTTVSPLKRPGRGEARHFEGTGNSNVPLSCHLWNAFGASYFSRSTQWPLFKPFALSQCIATSDAMATILHRQPRNIRRL